MRQNWRIVAALVFAFAVFTVEAIRDNWRRM